jgi:hypothetical protein
MEPPCLRKKFGICLALSTAFPPNAQKNKATAGNSTYSALTAAPLT